MDIFDFIVLLGGLAFFLFGMTTMSTGLERLAGGKLESTLRAMTSSPFKALLLGAGVTIAVQSSSAVTVMLVGLVNSGIMQIGQTVGVIMGSNIGTTLTAWLLSLVGLEGDTVWLKMLKPENFSLVFALVGAFMMMMAKKAKTKDIGSILVGFAVLMYGMKLMGDSVEGLAESPAFSSLLVAFKNPLLGVLTGAVVTGIIQSSAASVGILQALALTGGISYGMAIPIIMGQNIGTCVTALISCIGVSRNAKKVAVIHVGFNLIGTVILLSLYLLANALFHIPINDQPATAFGIAVVHSIFNVVTTFLLFPFSQLLVKIANTVLREKTAEVPAAGEEDLVLDELLLATPGVALSVCDEMTDKMEEVSRRSLLAAMKLMGGFDEEVAQSVQTDEDIVDRYEDKIGSFLVKLSAKSLSDADSRKVSKLLHAIGDFERMSDHAVNIMESARELHNKGIRFSEAAHREVKVLSEAVKEILELSGQAYNCWDAELALQVEPLEELIDNLVSQIRENHIQRLREGRCTIELGFILSDILTNYERVSDHCSNLAVTVVGLTHGNLESHENLISIKHDEESFRALYEGYKQKYAI